MSKLEFVAVQFGVKFSYLQFVLLCGWSLPAISTFIHLFRNFVILQIISWFYHDFIHFQGHLYYSLYGSTALGSHFYSERVMLQFYWLIKTADRRRGRLPYLHPLETLKC